MQNTSGLQSDVGKPAVDSDCTVRTLVLERAAYTLHNRVRDIRGRVDKVEVLSTGLTNETRVTLVVVDVRGDILPELLEDEGATGEVECCEAWVRDDLRDNFGGWSRDELENTSW